MGSTILFPKKPVEHARRSSTQPVCTNGLHLATNPLVRSVVRPFSEVSPPGSDPEGKQRQWTGPARKRWCAEAVSVLNSPARGSPLVNAMALQSGLITFRLVCNSLGTFSFTYEYYVFERKYL